jgi:hypothetical protein
MLELLLCSLLTIFPDTGGVSRRFFKFATLRPGWRPVVISP